MPLPTEEAIMICRRAGAHWAELVYGQTSRILGGRSPQKADRAGIKAERFWPFPRQIENARAVYDGLVIDGRLDREHEAELVGVILRAAAARYDELCAAGNTAATAGPSPLEHFAERST